MSGSRLAGAIVLLWAIAQGSSWPARAADELYRSAQREASVNWYAVWAKDIIDPLTKKFEATFPGVGLNVFRSGSAKVAAKLEAEFQGGKVLADVVTLAEEFFMRTFKAKQYIEPYPTAHFAAFPPEFRDAEGYWVTPRIIAVGIWYNVDRLKRLNLPVPESWHDLANPAYRNEVIIPSPLYSGTWSSFVGAFSQLNGFGWEYFARIAANSPLYVADIPDVARGVAAGQRAIGPVILAAVVTHPAHPRGTITMVKPKEGLLIVQSSSALVRNRPHAQAGKLLQTFLASAEAGRIITEAKSQSGRTDVPAPEGVPSPPPAIFPDVDWLAKHSGDLRQKWTEVTGQR